MFSDTTRTAILLCLMFVADFLVGMVYIDYYFKWHSCFHDWMTRTCFFFWVPGAVIGCAALALTGAFKGKLQDNLLKNWIIGGSIIALLLLLPWLFFLLVGYVFWRSGGMH